VLSILALAFFSKDKNTWLTFVKKNALNLYLILLVGAVIIILYYSEVALFTPCKLCWFQRLFIFPQILLILVAKAKKDISNIFNYLSWMTGFGLAFSLIHNYVYYFGEETALTCDAAASCKAYYVYEYGFVTIPFMALGLLLSLGTILLIRKYYKGNN
jgi:disulfide bond formation protein DsbB